MFIRFLFETKGVHSVLEERLVEEEDCSFKKANAYKSRSRKDLGLDGEGFLEIRGHKCPSPQSSRKRMLRRNAATSWSKQLRFRNQISHSPLSLILTWKNTVNIDHGIYRPGYQDSNASCSQTVLFLLWTSGNESCFLFSLKTFWVRKMPCVAVRCYYRVNHE